MRCKCQNVQKSRECVRVQKNVVRRREEYRAENGERSNLELTPEKNTGHDRETPGWPVHVHSALSFCGPFAPLTARQNRSQGQMATQTNCQASCQACKAMALSGEPTRLPSDPSGLTAVDLTAEFGPCLLPQPLPLLLSVSPASEMLGQLQWKAPATKRAVAIGCPLQTGIPDSTVPFPVHSSCLPR